MTIEELLKALDPIPDDWELAPYGQLQGVMDGSWKQILLGTCAIWPIARRNGRLMETDIYSAS